MPKDNPIPSSVRFFVLNRDGFACRYCNRGVADGAILELDHIKPRAAGGTDDVDNLCAACTVCNNGKRATTGINPPLGADSRQRAATPGLRGKGIVEMDNGSAIHAGIVRDELCGGAYLLIQLFDAFHGEPSNMVLAPISEITARGRCKIFEDLDHMNAWLEAHDQ